MEYDPKSVKYKENLLSAISFHSQPKRKSNSCSAIPKKIKYQKVMSK